MKPAERTWIARLQESLLCHLAGLDVSTLPRAVPRTHALASKVAITWAQTNYAGYRHYTRPLNNAGVRLSQPTIRQHRERIGSQRFFPSSPPVAIHHGSGAT